MKLLRARPWLMTLLTAFFIFGFGQAAAGEWRGTIADVGGVKHVRNPADGIEKPLTVEMKEQWRLGGTEDAEAFFGVIGQVLVDDDGTVYILDTQLNEIQVYSATGEFLKTIGREGEGPGEFRGPTGMFFVGDNLSVIQMFPGRLISLTKDGEPQDDLPVPAGEGGMPSGLMGGGTLGDQIAIAGFEQSFAEGAYKQIRYIGLIDREGAETKRLYSEDRPFDLEHPVIDEKVWDTFDRRWHNTPDGSRVFACIDRDPYKITVWDSSGEKEMVIEREYPPRVRTQEEKARIQAIYEGFTKQVPGEPEIKIYDQDKAISSMYSRPDGSLWVLSSRGSLDNPDGSIGVFDVFNKQGQLVRQVTLQGEGDPQDDGFIFAGDHLFVLTGFLDATMAAQGGGTAEEEDSEDDPSPMGIICYNLDVPNMGT